MYHAMSKIIFNVVNDGVDPTNMTNISISNINTKTTINMPQAIANAAPYLSCGSNATNNVAVASVPATITVWGTTGTGAVSAANTANGVAVIVPPQTTDANSKVSITVDGKTATANFNNITLAPGYVYTYNLKLKGQSLTITLVSITDWESGGAAQDLDFDSWS